MTGNAGMASLLEVPALAELLAATPSVELARGKALFQAGEPCISLPVIESGSARIYTHDDTGRQATLYQLEAGTVCPVSLATLLQDGAYPATAIADVSVQVRYLPGEQLKATISSTPEIFIAFLEAFSRYLQDNTMCLLAHTSPIKPWTGVKMHL